MMPHHQSFDMIMKRCLVLIWSFDRLRDGVEYGRSRNFAAIVQLRQALDGGIGGPEIDYELDDLTNPIDI
jgi:hypothetical protein